MQEKLRQKIIDMKITQEILRQEKKGESNSRRSLSS